jgi:hypothetical protein
VVDAVTGRVVARRSFGISLTFSKALWSRVRDTALTRFEPAGYEIVVGQIQDRRRHPSDPTEGCVTFSAADPTPEPFDVVLDAPLSLHPVSESAMVAAVTRTARGLLG